jgi:anti-anti-sigma factor
MAATTPAPTDLSGTISTSHGVALLALFGEIDLASAPALRELLFQGALVAGTTLVVDVAAVTFCDCQGLGALVAANKDLRARDCRLTVRHATGGVRRLFLLAGLSAYLEDSVGVDDEALMDQLVLGSRGASTRALLDGALRLVTTMSQAVIPHAHGASITLSREGRLQTVAASNDVVLHMDLDQYSTGQGPCLDAAVTGSQLYSPSLASEDRWPDFVPKARARGIESILSSPLLARGRPVGALNVYSRGEGALAEHEQLWATEFAQQASTLLSEANAEPSSEVLAQELAEALMAREVIAIAQGVVMDRRNLTPATALRFLVDISRSTSRPLLTVCREVVATVVRRGGSDDTSRR